MTTALDLIGDALGLTNAVGVDQDLTDSEVQDCLRAMNDLIGEWSTQNLAVYGQANQSFNTVVGQFVYTIGTGGNWATTRPERINAPAYSVVSGSSFPCLPMTQGEYNGISNKAQTQTYPDFYLYVNENPLGLVTLWPVPSAITPITLSIDRVLTSIATATTVLSFPPGYLKAFKYALGVEYAPAFGKKISQYPDIVEIANRSFGNIKRANKKQRVMRCDPSYSDSGYGFVDWRTG